MQSTQRTTETAQVGMEKDHRASAHHNTRVGELNPRSVPQCALGIVTVVVVPVLFRDAPPCNIEYDDGGSFEKGRYERTIYLGR